MACTPITYLSHPNAVQPLHCVTHAYPQHLLIAVVDATALPQKRPVCVVMLHMKAREQQSR